METTIRLTHRSRSNGPPCLWMQAGIVSRKFCKRDYQCYGCPFERALKRVADQNSRCKQNGTPLAGKRGAIVSWKDRLRTLPPWKQPCLHHMKGRIDFRACTHAYRCTDCEFDQYFDDQHTVHAVVTPVDILEMDGFRVPQGYYFHRGHAWAKLEEGSSVRVGMDDFSVRLLGPLDIVEAPLLGKEIRQHQGDVTVRRGEHAAKVLSPVSGVVTAINPSLRKKGYLANERPFSEGWIMRVHAKNLRQELKHLMLNAETVGFMREEIDGLYRMIEHTAGPLAADGGLLGNDIFGNLPGIGWENLTRRFLRT